MAKRIKQMKNYIFLIVLIALLSLLGCLDDYEADVSELNEINLRLSGNWRSTSYLVNGEESPTNGIDSFDISFDIDTLRPAGRIRTIEYRNLPNTFLATSSRNYWLIEGSQLLGGLIDTLSYSFQDDQLIIVYSRSNGDIVNTVLSRQ